MLSPDGLLTLFVTPRISTKVIMSSGHQRDGDSWKLQSASCFMDMVGDIRRYVFQLVKSNEASPSTRISGAVW